MLKIDRSVDLRTTHPTMFRSAIVFALISVGLGFNFLFTNPTFNPYGIDKAITGSLFLMVGVSKLVSLLLLHNLMFVRLTMALCMAFMAFWGVGTSITFFTGQTSLQLFILYSGLTALQLMLLLEPYINPLTASSSGTDKRYVDNT